jgi:hypothetical protein
MTADDKISGSQADVNRFVNRYLRSDGVFVLRMITMHSGIIFGTDLVLSLWKAFYGIEEQYRKDHERNPPVKIKSENSNNMLRLRKKHNKKGKVSDSDDDALIAGLVAKKLHRSSSRSRSSSSSEDQRKGKRPSAPVETAMAVAKSLALAEAVNAGLDLLRSSSPTELDKQNTNQRQDDN